MVSIGVLRENAKRLELEMMEAERLFSAARQRSAPFENAFWAAHRNLESLWDLRNTGRLVNKVEMLKAYDERVFSGHKWHPYKSECRNLEIWLKAIRKELIAVNKEIGI